MSFWWTVFVCVCIVVFFVSSVRLIYIMFKYGDVVDTSTKNLES